MIKTALIDGDILAHSCGWLDVDSSIAKSIFKHKLNKIVENVGCSDYQLFLSPSITFRHSLSPDYKANRITKRPPNIEVLKEYMIKHYGAIMGKNCEADDLLGCNQDDNSIICSLDKDLLQISGKHYRWPIYRKDEIVSQEQFITIEEEEGLRWFYQQMLIGDTSDNIKGVDKIGPQKAQAIIDECKDEHEMINITKEMYNDDFRWATNADLLWIWRSIGVSYSVRQDML